MHCQPSAPASQAGAAVAPPSPAHSLPAAVAKESMPLSTSEGEADAVANLAPPCRHNAWQRVRKLRKRSGVLLRCLVCESNWPTQKELHTKCGEFYRGKCALGGACSSPHVYARGTLPPEVVAARKQIAAERMGSDALSGDADGAEGVDAVAADAGAAAAAVQVEVVTSTPLRQLRDEKQRQRREEKRRARRAARAAAAAAAAPEGCGGLAAAAAAADCSGATPSTSLQSLSTLATTATTLSTVSSPVSEACLSGEDVSSCEGGGSPVAQTLVPAPSFYRYDPYAPGWTVSTSQL